MKSRVIFGLLAFAFSLLVLWGASLAVEGWNGEGRYMELTTSGANLVLSGETFWTDFNRKELRGKSGCRVEGDAVVLLGEIRDKHKQMRFGFRAAEPGKAVIIIGERENEMRYRIRVVTDADVPVVNISDIIGKPGDYQYRLFRIVGKNRGWGMPEHAAKVWGAHVTRSDWVLQDNTGAVNVTGQTPPQPKHIAVIAYLAPVGAEWSVNAVKVSEAPEVPAVPVYTKMKADIKLDAKRMNMMRVGQVGIIDVSPDRSHVFDYEIEGNAVSAAGSNRDELYVKADRAGETTIKIYLRFWREIEIPGAPEPPKRTPVAVYHIRVIRP